MELVDVWKKGAEVWCDHEDSDSHIKSKLICYPYHQVLFLKNMPFLLFLSCLHFLSIYIIYWNLIDTFFIFFSCFYLVYIFFQYILYIQILLTYFWYIFYIFFRLIRELINEDPTCSVKQKTFLLIFRKYVLCVPI